MKAVRSTVEPEAWQTAKYEVITSVSALDSVVAGYLFAQVLILEKINSSHILGL